LANCLIFGAQLSARFDRNFGGTAAWEGVLSCFDNGDGSAPSAPPVVAAHGVLYGTTTAGGIGCRYSGCGTVFALAAPATGSG
jgi:hypothetical protein